MGWNNKWKNQKYGIKINYDERRIRKITINEIGNCLTKLTKTATTHERISWGSAKKRRCFEITNGKIAKA